MAEYPALEIEFPADDASLPDRLYALLDDFEPAAIHDDDSGSSWRVFFRTGAARDAARTAVASLSGVRASSIDVSDEDWARRSQENLRAIEAGGLIVAPPWDVPRGGSTPVIIIEPSTGFGTGHHATTRLCLLMLQQLELRGARVLDVGTGSGVLALAAWKLGAGDVVAVDNDPDALDNARNNIARNGAAAGIDIIRDDVDTLRIQRADIVLANLTGAVLVRYAAELQSLVVDGGYLILSGFAPQDVNVIRAAFRGLSAIDEKVDGDWAALCLRG
ncbi:MAG TPA: 50S ribosomal protein L11 methyltransferase [Vicinamibacterales bacterium]|nr:50S ribosomal protein L11 methyltransferase [Vicinamibacterales bacterium]